MKNYLGIDIGGTGIKLGIVNENNELIYKESFPTRKGNGSDTVIEDILSHVSVLVENYKPECIGVGCPGDKDDDNVSILSAGNIPFKNLHIVQILKDAFGLEVYLENDGNCALIGEWLVGSGKGLEDMVMVTIGTGIGGGCIVGGRVLRGLHNDAGELGHFVIDPSGEECPCGQKGCFEKFASATALIRQTGIAVKENPSSILASIVNENGLDGKSAFNAYKKGCPVAAKVLENYGKRLADGINGLMFIFAPELLTLAGGVTRDGDTLFGFVKPHLIFPDRVGISMLQSDAGVIGAALLHNFADYYLSLRK